MDTEAFFKYEQPQNFENHDEFYNVDENPFILDGFQQRPTENLESTQNNNHISSNTHNTSFVSTNCSFKNTPEYISENLSMGSLNQEEKRNIHEIPKVKKAIYKKNYEPIFDNNFIYHYEQDPNEYRKARKFFNIFFF